METNHHSFKKKEGSSVDAAQFYFSVCIIFRIAFATSSTKVTT